MAALLGPQRPRYLPAGTLPVSLLGRRGSLPAMVMGVAEGSREKY